MKKILKKVGLLAFACLLFSQAIIPAMAEPNFSGVDPNVPGSITIHRFAGSTPAEPTSGTPLNGIPYTIELVRLIPGTDPTPANLRNPDNFEPVTGGFSATESTVNGIASFTDLPHGIFRVTEGTHTVTPAADRVDPFIVGIPRRAADGEWIYDVDAFPKTEEDTVINLEKELDVAWDDELEEVVATWTLETVIPRLIGNATRFEFVDELDWRLTFVPGSLVGTYLRMEMDEITETLNQYEATLPSSAFTYDVDANNVLTISLTQDGFNHLAQYAVLAPEGTLTFTFRTILATDETSFGLLTNEARIYYNEDEPIITVTPPTEFLFGIEIEKIDVNGDHLDGAVFELFLDSAGNDPAFPNATGNNREFTTVNGVVLIPNVREGTFYLQEVLPPPGHQPITDFMPVTVNEAAANADRNYVVTIQIVNEVEGGFTLPETGGMGTLIFTVTGLILIGGALSLALIARRRRGQND